MKVLVLVHPPFGFEEVWGKEGLVVWTSTLDDHQLKEVSFPYFLYIQNEAPPF